MAKDALSVITEATEDIIEDLRKDYEVKKTRMYEMLGDQCTYPKTKVLIRRIAAHNQAGARLIKADMDAMWADILGPETEPVTDAELHEELNDAVQAKLRHAPRCVELKEDREAVEVLSRRICEIEKEDMPTVRVEMAKLVEQKRSNGNR